LELSSSLSRSLRLPIVVRRTRPGPVSGHQSHLPFRYCRFFPQKILQPLPPPRFRTTRPVREIACRNAAILRLGKSFSIHEWSGSGPATLHVHHSDDEAWHVIEGKLTFRYSDRTEAAGPGTTVFVPAGTVHTYTAGPGSRYLIVLTPRLRELIATLQADRDPAHQQEIYRRFDSELLE